LRARKALHSESRAKNVRVRLVVVLAFVGRAVGVASALVGAAGGASAAGSGRSLWRNPHEPREPVER